MGGLARTSPLRGEGVSGDCTCQVSVLPTERGTHNVSVTVPASGQIDWSSVEAIEPERPGTRVAAHVLMGLGLAGIFIGGGYVSASGLEGLFGVMAGIGCGILSVPFYISSGFAMDETRRLVEGARAHHVQAAASSRAPLSIAVEAAPLAPAVDGVTEGDEPSAAPPAGVEGP